MTSPTIWCTDMKHFGDITPMPKAMVDITIRRLLPFVGDVNDS